MDADDPPRSICWRCARWKLYRYTIAERLTEGWRCTNGVQDAGRRTECVVFLREIGVDDE